MKIKNLGKKNIILLIIIAVLLLVVGGSLAFFGWNSTAENKDRIVDVTINTGSGECSKLTDNTKLLVPTSSRANGRIITMKAKQTMADNAVITWTLTVNKLNTDDTTTNGLKNESFKYELINNTTGVSYGSGNFANITNTNNIITFSTTKETLDYNVDYEFILYLWIDGVTFGNNPLDMVSQEYNFDMNCNITGVDNKIEAPLYASTYITNLYTPNDTATNNGVTYNLDTEDQIMKDVDGNIRYYGNEPNNYIYFNCNYYPETNCELWRIIGIFNNHLKIMKNEPLGQYPFSSSIAGYTGNWNESAIKTLLNGAYLNNDDTSYYKYDSNTKTVEPIDVLFNTDRTGIKDETFSLIANSSYNLGGIDSPIEYVNIIYESEKGINVPDSSFLTVWQGKIGLPYLSDYGYAVDLDKCDKTLYEYNESLCINNNWMYTISDNGYDNYTMTPSSHYSPQITAIASTGSGFNAYPIRNYNIFPVLFLNEDVVISTTSDGSKDFPYRLIVE